jgi:hypothetical protein
MSPSTRLSTCAALLAALLAPAPAPAAVKVSAPKGVDDAVRRAILSGPKLPANVYEVRQHLLKGGGKLEAHVLANRGHSNPGQGSFSFFMTYSGPMKGGKVAPGDLFFGFFTEAGADGVLRVRPGVFIELIAWDYTKKVFNFWELVEDGADVNWRYAGDSHDVLADVAELNLGLARPKLGRRVRCSACHTLGGPVMKELAAPHNDWLTAANKLFLGKLELRPGKDAANPAHVAAELLSRPADGAAFAALVRGGIDRLVEARAARKGDGQTLRQQLRSLFTTMEMNLVYDTAPFATRAARGEALQLPAEFFVDARLAGPGARPVAVPFAVYRQGLNKLGARFAPGEAKGLVESYHAFSVPARSYVDNKVIDSLIKQGLLDDELVAAVLAVDFTTPVYSRRRAALLRYVPERARDAADLKAKLIAALKAAKGDEAAAELLANLTDPARDAAYHRKRALAYLRTCAKAASSARAVEDWLRVAAQRRREVRAADTAKLEGGDDVIEEGFKVLFPAFNFTPEPGKLRLSSKTGMVER